MPSHNPSRPRKPRRSRGKQPAGLQAGRDDTAAPEQHGVQPVLTPPEEQVAELTEWRLVGTVEDWAPVLMSTNYADHLAIEDAAAAEQRSAVAQFFRPSSYRARSSTSTGLHGERLQSYDARTADRQRDSVAHLRRAVNQRDWSFSILARSISWFNQRIPHRVWNSEQKAGRVAHRDTCTRLLNACSKLLCVRFALHRSVAVFGADQTYAWQGMSKTAKHHRAVERLDAAGVPIEIKHLVYVNCVQVLLPHNFPALNGIELLQIALHGPYTEPYANLYAPLNPARVQQDLRSYAHEVARHLRDAVPPGTQVDQITLRAIAQATFGYPDTDPRGPTPIEITPPLLDTDTKSYNDLMKIFSWCLRFVAYLVTLICLVLFGDGQTVLRARDLKRKFPKTYKRLLIGCGFFHHLAHLLFALNEAFWLCFGCACAAQLGKEKVYQQMKNLEHDNWKHIVTFFQVVTCACLAFILQDVSDPPPELFLRDHDAYAARVHHAGGKVILEFLKHVGYVLSVWQRAGRSGDGARCRQLLGYSFHIFRSVAHKVGSVHIALISLVGLYCAHPKLQAMLMACSSISLLGRRGRNMFIDRLLEAINFLQQKRMSSFVGFETGLHNTHLLQPMLRIDHAWQDAIHGRTPTDDVMTLSMMVEARKLQDWFVELCGTDLTVDDDENPFWHTGNPVSLERGDYRERKPWEWIWRVSAGLVSGKGRSDQRPLSWSAYVRAFIASGLWERP